jgi:hypothetical protein
LFLYTVMTLNKANYRFFGKTYMPIFVIVQGCLDLFPHESSMTDGFFTFLAQFIPFASVSSLMVAK